MIVDEQYPRYSHARSLHSAQSTRSNKRTKEGVLERVGACEEPKLTIALFDQVSAAAQLVVPQGVVGGQLGEFGLAVPVAVGEQRQHTLVERPQGLRLFCVHR